MSIMHKNLSIIVAVAKNDVIGRENQLVWHIPEDLKRFKALTMGHHIIMGRKTWEAIGRPLPGRKSVVVSRNSNLHVEGAKLALSLNEAISIARDDSEIFVIGGGELYRQALPFASRLYVTHILTPFDGDTTFPSIDPNIWQAEPVESTEPTGGEGLSYNFVNYTRKSI